MDGDTRRATYRRLEQEIEAVLEGLDDAVAVMATTACVIHHALPYASWTGFYRVVSPAMLRIGPYQGALGCLEIPFDRGVCGAAARQRATQLVPDVNAFPGHVACDAAARSEIVVPVFDASGEMVAVLDVDSHQPAAFDEVDRDGLESMMTIVSRHLAPAALAD